MATVWKAIKASALKRDAMRLALLNAMRDAGNDIKKDFEKTTATWKHKPKFEVLRSLSVNDPGPTVAVLTDDPVYRYVDEGTREHIIQPKRAKVLRFAGTYTAKTTPGVIGSKSGGPSGDELYRPYVFHPGTQERGFSKAIAKKWQRPFRERMERAMRAARDASGHAI